MHVLNQLIAISEAFEGGKGGCRRSHSGRLVGGGGGVANGEIGLGRQYGEMKLG